MYKIGDVVELEYVIDIIMYKRECPIKYGVYCKLTNEYVGVFLFDDLITWTHNPHNIFTGDTVKIKTSIIEISKTTDFVDYTLEFKNGVIMVVKDSDLPKKFKIGDNIKIECKVASYNYFRDKENPKNNYSKIYIRIPGNYGTHGLIGSYTPKDLEAMDTVDIIGTVTSVLDSELEINTTLITNKTFIITTKYLDKVEVIK